MSEPMKKLENAKKMLEMGLINQADFDDIKKQVLAEMGMAVSKPPVEEQQPTSSSSGDLFGSTLNSALLLQ